MRTFVILGIILIIVSLVGAKWALDHQTPAKASSHKNGADANQPPDKIVCWGFFDVEPGVAGLYPKQFGDIVDVKPENYVAKKGEVLLQVNDAIVQFKVKQAQAAVEAAKLQVDEAEKLTELYILQKEMQGYVINGLDHKHAEMKLKEKTDIKTAENDANASRKKSIEDLYKEAFAQLALQKKAEEAKLKQLKLQDADLKIKQAKAELHAKNVQLEEAQEMLNHFKIVAPADGTVLRVFVHKGETLGPTPRVQALDFLPKADIIVRAEVLQEWGRFIKDPKDNPGITQEVEIQDDTYNGPKWEGKVIKVLGYYAPTRSPVIEPLRYNDVRTLECLISVEKGDARKRIGQRVRAMIKISN